MVNFKKDKPELFDMMGEYYQLLQKHYDSVDIKAILKDCDAFVNKWAVGADDKQSYMVQGLVQGVLTWKDEEIRGGK